MWGCIWVCVCSGIYTVCVVPRLASYWLVGGWHHIAVKQKLFTPLSPFYILKKEAGSVVCCYFQQIRQTEQSDVSLPCGQFFHTDSADVQKQKVSCKSLFSKHTHVYPCSSTTTSRSSSREVSHWFVFDVIIPPCFFFSPSAKQTPHVDLQVTHPEWSVDPVSVFFAPKVRTRGCRCVFFFKKKKKQTEASLSEPCLSACAFLQMSKYVC